MEEKLRIWVTLWSRTTFQKRETLKRRITTSAPPTWRHSRSW